MLINKFRLLKFKSRNQIRQCSTESPTAYQAFKDSVIQPLMKFAVYGVTAAGVFMALRGLKLIVSPPQKKEDEEQRKVSWKEEPINPVLASENNESEQNELKIVINESNSIGINKSNDNIVVDNNSVPLSFPVVIEKEPARGKWAIEEDKENEINDINIEVDHLLKNSPTINVQPPRKWGSEEIVEEIEEILEIKKEEEEPKKESSWTSSWW